MEPFLELHQVSLSALGAEPVSNFSLNIFPKQALAILGGNASDNKFLLEILSTKKPPNKGEIIFNLPKSKIGVVPFNSSQLYLNRWEMYYQKRFNQFDSDFIPNILEFTTPEIEKFFWDNKSLHSLVQLLKLEHLLDRKIHELSHGEMKRFLLFYCLIKKPQLIILDNPLEGIDPINQKILEVLFRKLIRDGLALVFILSQFEVPTYIHQILFINQAKNIELPVSEWEILKDDLMGQVSAKTQVPQNTLTSNLRINNYREESIDSQPIILEMRNLSIGYGTKTVLSNIRWTVRKEEHWWIEGSNGSGKSTLLSIITGDHPQAYQDSYFWMGKVRGSGESIWDIKKSIGFMSPEMLIYLPKDQNCFQMVASGLFDTQGLFKRLTPHQIELVNLQIEEMNLNDLKTRFIHKIPVTEQRLILLARAFIKKPPLLILDEPFQGLADHDRSLLKSKLEISLKKNNQTLLFTSHHASDIPSTINRLLSLKS